MYRTAPGLCLLEKCNKNLLIIVLVCWVSISKTVPEKRIHLPTCVGVLIQVLQRIILLIIIISNLIVTSSTTNLRYAENTQEMRILVWISFTPCYKFNHKLEICRKYINKQQILGWQSKIDFILYIRGVKFGPLAI